MSSRVNAIIPAGAGLIPSTRSTAFDECWSTQTTGPNTRESTSIGTRQREREHLRLLQRDRLRDELAEHDAQVRQDGERDHEGDAAREEVEVARDERLADRTEGDPDDGDPDLDGRDEPDGLVHQPERGARRPAAALRALLEPVAARRDERVLGRDEDRVQEHEDEHDEDARDVAHRDLLPERMVAPLPGRGYWAVARRPLRPKYRSRRRRPPGAGRRPRGRAARGARASRRPRSAAPRA